jgi:hypothetical protein
MNSQPTLDEIIDECIERIARGEPLDEVLLAYPQHGPDLLPLLRAASAMLGASARVTSPAASPVALQRMIAALEGARAAGAPAAPRFGWLSSFRGRPSAYQGAALAGALLLFGALGLGGAAATGNAPEPVRAFFGVSSTSVIQVDDCDDAAPGATPTAGTPAATATPEFDDDDDDGDDSDNNGPGGDDDGDDHEDDQGEDDAEDVCATTTPQATPTVGPPVATATPDLDDEDEDDGAGDDVDDGDLDDVDDGAVDDVDDGDLNDVDDADVDDAETGD